MSALRHTPLRRALWRQNLVLGGERELVLFTGLLCAAVAVSSGSVVTVLIGGFAWLVSIGPLRLMAKNDPQMSRVYVRYIQYAPYYPPRSRPARSQQSLGDR